jgi:aminoglycoside phosphotransferase (APT) family kinase protein
MTDVSNPPSIAARLDPALVAWVETAAGGRVVAWRVHAGDGNSREGAFVTVERDGTHRRLFLTVDKQRRADKRDAFRREASVLAVLSEMGVKVPRLVAASHEHWALLSEFVPGDVSLSAVKSPEERQALALGFVRELAEVHRLAIDPRKLDGFDPVDSVAANARERVEQLDERHALGPVDPVVVFAIEWLKSHVPAWDGAATLVHGDAGPSNFMFRDGEVVALIDWELTHFGDPLEDFAWVCIRSQFQPFAELPQCFAEYERVLGTHVDLDRVRFYRILAHVYVIITFQERLRLPAEDYGASLGHMLSYYLLHMRGMAEALAEAAGIDLEPFVAPAVPAPAEDNFFAIALKDLRGEIVPHLDHAGAAHRAKGLARIIKYWQQKARLGPTFDAAERAEIGALCDQVFDAVAPARHALAQRIRASTLPDRAVLPVLYRRVCRDLALLAPALGYLVDWHHLPLVDSPTQRSRT